LAFSFYGKLCFALRDKGRPLITYFLIVTLLLNDGGNYTFSGIIARGQSLSLACLRQQNRVFIDHLFFEVATGSLWGFGNKGMV
jgi:hypothetical protein